MTYFLFIIGLVVLMKGVDLLVGSSAKIANYFGIPAFIVGLSIVAFGTSAPESAIGVISALNGANQITLGDVIGSSIANILLIIGLAAVISPLSVNPLVARREIPVLLCIQIMLTIMVVTGGHVSRLEASILLAGFLSFLAYLVYNAKKIIADEKPSDKAEALLFDLMEKERVIGEEAVDGSLAPTLETNGSRFAILAGKFLIGLTLLILGGHTVVTNGTAIATSLGLSKEFIGVTVIALGTSLPELMTSAVAALHHEEGIALGNIIGSNIFNVLFVLGVSASIHPIEAHQEIIWDCLAMIAATICLSVPVFRLGRISRLSGIQFLFFYLIFVAIKTMIATIH